MPFTPIEVGGPTNPLGVVVGILDFLGALLGLGRNDTKTLATAVNNTWANLVFTTAFLYNAVGFLTEFIKKFLGIVLGGIVHIISDVLHGHLAQALKDIQALFHALHNLFAPLLLWLRKLQAIQRQQQMLAMRRILNLIQRVRQILLPFRLLHLKFAQKLDNWLAGIEGRIITRELAIAAKTNQIIAWIDLITHPTGVLRGGPIGAGIGNAYAVLRAALLAAGVENIFPALRRVYRDPIPARPFSEFVDQFQLERVSSTGDYGDFAAGVTDAYRRMKEELGT